MRETETFLAGKPDDGIAYDVMRRLLERSEQPQQFVSISARRNIEVDQFRPAKGQRAGLVKNCGANVRQRLKRCTPFHHDTNPSCARDPADEGYRSSKDQRTGGRDDQDGKRPDRIA